MVQSASSFVEFAADVRPRIDAALDGYLPTAAQCPQRLLDAMRYSLLAPGKRLRPLLVLAAAEACGGSEHAAMPAACAVEMVHAYSLVHDDLPAMDDDQMRRGRPTCHTAFDEATAILAGDALLALAFEVLARDVTPSDVAAACVRALSRAAGPTQLVGGQADDLDPSGTAGGIEALESIHRRKTGAVLHAALRMGGLTAGAADGDLAALDRYGLRLGLAFQIVDDLLDVRGEEATVGKRLNKDADRGKLTFPALLGIDASARRAEALVDEARAALEVFGASAGRLKSLARYVLERDR